LWLGRLNHDYPLLRSPAVMPLVAGTIFMFDSSI
jgi:hypothetical protein